MRYVQRVAAVLVAALLVLPGCGKQATMQGDLPVKDTAAVKDAAVTASEGVRLTPEEIATLGIGTEPAAPIQYSKEISGYGTIIAHDTIAQAAAEVDAAQATARLSDSARARARRLDSTPGALSADTVDALAQKVVVDESALRLARQKLSALYGRNPPWGRPGGASLLEQVANGDTKLLRATFPPGALPGEAPRHLRVRHLYADATQQYWNLNVVWDAPADSSAPGRNFFALVKASDAQEGERLQVWAPIGNSVSGVLVPKSAVVMSGGKFWCYVERKNDDFEKVELDPEQASGDGYFLQQGVEPGDRLVVKAAGQLLAKETGSSVAAD